MPAGLEIPNLMRPITSPNTSLKVACGVKTNNT